MVGNISELPMCNTQERFRISEKTREAKCPWSRTIQNIDSIYWQWIVDGFSVLSQRVHVELIRYTNENGDDADRTMT